MMITYQKQVNKREQRLNAKQQINIVYSSLEYLILGNYSQQNIQQAIILDISQYNNQIDRQLTIIISKEIRELGIGECSHKYRKSGKWQRKYKYNLVISQNKKITFAAFLSYLDCCIQQQQLKIIQRKKQSSITQQKSMNRKVGQIINKYENKASDSDSADDDRHRHPYTLQQSSDQQIDMQKYIKPVRQMLGKYKESISSIRQNQRMLTRSTTDISTNNSHINIHFIENNQNLCPNATKRNHMSKGIERQRQKEINLKTQKGRKCISKQKQQEQETGHKNKQISLKQLDQQIEQLTKKLQLY